MGQIAYTLNERKMLEAFSLTDKEWGELSALPRGSILMPHSNWPAIPKVSIHGLRFFAHYQGYPYSLPTPKSYAHTRLQIDIVRAARNLGLKANLEVSGSDSDGNEWVADVLIESKSTQKFAFEVQLSSQHYKDFIKRTERYERSNMKSCWFISNKPVADRLCKAIAYQNKDFYKKHGQFLGDDPRLVTFDVDILNKNSYPDLLPPVRFGRGKFHKRLTLSESIYGMVNGFPYWECPDWKWLDDKNII